MPARSHPVATALWGRRFRDLSPGAKLVHLYALTCPHRRSEGLYELAPAHASVDTGLDVDRVLEALEELTDAGFLMYDQDAELVLDPGALKVSPLRNGEKPDKRIDPAVRHFELLPASPLKERFVEVAEDASPDLAAAIKARAPDPSEGASGGALQGESRAPSREEKSRDELEKSGDEAVPCANCGESALVKFGEVQVGPDEKPWCTFCEVAA